MFKINEGQILFCEWSAMVTNCVTDFFRWFCGSFRKVYEKKFGNFAVHLPEGIMINSVCLCLLYRLVKSYGDTWIGGTDVAVEGEYKWAGGEALTWPDFLSGSAPTSDTLKNCLITTGTLKWEHRNCAEKHPIMCEVEIGKF